MNLNDCIIAAQAILGRTLIAPEIEMTSRLLHAGKSLDDILAQLRTTEDEPVVPVDDDGLPTVRFEPAGDDVRQIP